MISTCSSMSTGTLSDRPPFYASANGKTVQRAHPEKTFGHDKDRNVNAAEAGPPGSGFWSVLRRPLPGPVNSGSAASDWRRCQRHGLTRACPTLSAGRLGLQSYLCLTAPTPEGPAMMTVPRRAARPGAASGGTLAAAAAFKFVGS